MRKPIDQIWHVFTRNVTTGITGSMLLHKLPLLTV
jgi:hypothetical protein